MAAAKRRPSGASNALGENLTDTPHSERKYIMIGHIHGQLLPKSHPSVITERGVSVFFFAITGAAVRGR